MISLGAKEISLVGGCVQGSTAFPSPTQKLKNSNDQSSAETECVERPEVVCISERSAQPVPFGLRAPAGFGENMLLSLNPAVKYTVLRHGTACLKSSSFLSIVHSANLVSGVPGSGEVQLQRRAAVCQLVTDFSDGIIGPLTMALEQIVV